MRCGGEHVSLGKISEHEDVIHRRRARKSPEVLRNEIGVESDGHLFCSGNDSCRSIRIDAYFRCDVERRCAVEEAYLKRQADSWRDGLALGIQRSVSDSNR